MKSIPRHTQQAVMIAVLVIVSFAGGYVFSKSIRPVPTSPAQPSAAPPTTRMPADPDVDPPQNNTFQHSSLEECIFQANQLDAPQQLIDEMIEECRQQYR